MEVNCASDPNTLRAKNEVEVAFELVLLPETMMSVGKV